MIYLDTAATSYYRPDCVAEAVADAVRTLGNPSRGAHGVSLNASRVLFETREKLCTLFHAGGPERIAFTSNATEALNTAIFGLGLSAGDHLLISVLDHNSVLRPAFRLQEAGVTVHVIGADTNGHPDYAALEKTLREIRGGSPYRKADGSAVRIAAALTHASNVTGNVTDLLQISGCLKEAEALLIVDAAQTAGLLPIDMEKDGIDVLCFSGHKSLMGPQGTGGLAVRQGLELIPLTEGGSGVQTFLPHMPEEMPERLEAGTRNAHGLAGLLAALRAAEGKEGESFRRADVLRHRFLAGIEALNAGKEADDAGKIRVYGAHEDAVHLPTVAFNIGNTDSSRVADYLWRKHEIAVRAGGHCAPLMHRHFGTEKQGMVRVSFSGYNTDAETDRLLTALLQFIREKC